MRTNVWILNHYAGGMLEAQGGRHYWMARELKAMGYAPVVFCANTLHNTDRAVDTGGALLVEKQAPDGFPFVFVKTTPYKGNGLSRVRNMLLFAHNVKRAAKRYAKEHGKPDVIYASSVHPFTLVAGQAIAKYFGVPCVCEARDLWPACIVAYGVAGRHNPAVVWMYGLEKRLYTRADALVFTMPGAKTYIAEQGWDAPHGPVDLSKVYYVNNGVDLRAFDENAARFALDDPDLDDPAVFKVLYAGSIRRVNELGTVLEAAALLRARKDVVFLIYGEGDEREALAREAKDRGLTNIRFKGAVGKTAVPGLLKRADLLLLHNRDTAVQRYGISQNKLFEYMAAGKPVLMTFPLSQEVFAYAGWGRTIPAQTPAAIAEAVAAFADMPDAEYAPMCAAAREEAKRYDFQTLSQTVAKALENA